MRRWVSLSLMALVITSAALAQDSRLRRLETGVDAKAWEAVGRLDINGKGFCTGALIAPKLVLTAAHCLFDPETAQPLSDGRIEFLAGWRNGRAGAYRDVRRAVWHPEYDFAGDASTRRVQHDIAILELEQPIRNTSITPFQTTSRPMKGDRVGVVSYALDRSEAPSLQEVCGVLGRQQGVLVTSCDVNFGSSGAPIFVFEKGKAQIVSVVSAKAELEGQNVSLGTALGRPLAELMADLKQGKGTYFKQTAGLAKAGERSRDIGAKFVRP